MKKAVLSCVAVLGLCVALPAMADVDETFMDWSYASGLDPKPRPQEQTSFGIREGAVDASAQNMMNDAAYDSGVYATSEMGGMVSGQNQTTASEYTSTSYSMTQNASTQGMNAGYEYVSGTNVAGGSDTVGGGYVVNGQNGQVSATPQYYQVPMTAIQTPAEVHHVNNPIKVRYPVTKQYPISMQYPVTVQKEITVQRPVVVQQPIVVQRPIVMQQPVMVQHEPLMVQNKPVMVQQQPTVVQKQPIVVNAPAPSVMPSVGYQMPTMSTVAQMPCGRPNCAYAQQPVMVQNNALQSRGVSVPVRVSGTFTGVAMPSSTCVGCTGY